MVADDRHRTGFKLLAHGFERLAGRSSLWGCQQDSDRQNRGQQNSEALRVQRFSVWQPLSMLAGPSLLIAMKDVQSFAYFLHSRAECNGFRQDCSLRCR
jgi:hypothetical protein